MCLINCKKKKKKRSSRLFSIIIFPLQFFGATTPTAEQRKLRCSVNVFLLTIVQPRHSDWQTSCENPVQPDVISFIHKAVLQGFCERRRIHTFTPWFWRRGVESGVNSTDLCLIMTTSLQLTALSFIVWAIKIEN